MKARFELSRAEVEAAITEYLQRTLSTTIVEARIDGHSVPEVFDLEVAFPEKLAPRGKTRCSACNAFGHNVATCPIPRPDNKQTEKETPQ